MPWTSTVMEQLNMIMLKYVKARVHNIYYNIMNSWLKIYIKGFDTTSKCPQNYIGHWVGPLVMLSRVILYN